MAANLRDLKLWQESVALAGDLTRALRQSTRRETKALTDRMMLTAVAIAEQVADGHGRYTSLEQREIYRAARRDLLLVETQMAVARHADLIPASAQTMLLDHVQLLHRLLAGYLVYLDRQITEENADRTPGSGRG
ncbi:MAG TPA: four helix bundle protein [Gemmatimonadaceae bacterium]|nr:four helix bundle protein [Gemmatimonadaceae bacterium]